VRRISIDAFGCASCAIINDVHIKEWRLQRV
jgi:hypothetical protein